MIEIYCLDRVQRGINLLQDVSIRSTFDPFVLHWSLLFDYHVADSVLLPAMLFKWPLPYYTGRCKWTEYGNPGRGMQAAFVLDTGDASKDVSVSADVTAASGSIHNNGAATAPSPPWMLIPFPPRYHDVNRHFEDKEVTFPEVAYLRLHSEAMSTTQMLSFRK